MDISEYGTREKLFKEQFWAEWSVEHRVTFRDTLADSDIDNEPGDTKITMTLQGDFIPICFMRP